MEYYLLCANKRGSNCIANFLEFVKVVVQKPVCEPFLFGEMDTPWRAFRPRAMVLCYVHWAI